MSPDEAKHIKNMFIQNPTLRKDIKRTLTEELLKGKISDDIYEEIFNIGESELNQQIEETVKKIPELKTDVEKNAQQGYIKGNIDINEYNRIKSYTQQKETPTKSVSKIAFIDPVNYKTKTKVLLK